MYRLRNVTVGIPVQAVMVIALTISWYVACGYTLQHLKEKVGNLWFAVLVLVPPLVILRVAVLWWSHSHSKRAQGAWVAAATLTALSPVILVLLMYAPL